MAGLISHRCMGSDCLHGTERFVSERSHFCGVSCRGLSRLEASLAPRKSRNVETARILVKVNKSRFDFVVRIPEINSEQAAYVACSAVPICQKVILNVHGNWNSLAALFGIELIWGVSLRDLISQSFDKLDLWQLTRPRCPTHHMITHRFETILSKYSPWILGHLRPEMAEVLVTLCSS